MALRDAFIIHEDRAIGTQQYAGGPKPERDVPASRGSQRYHPEPISGVSGAALSAKEQLKSTIQKAAGELFDMVGELDSETDIGVVKYNAQAAAEAILDAVKKA